MTILMRRIFLTASTVFIGLIAVETARAVDSKINIGYQTVVEPSKVPQADGEYEKATNAEINWRKFDSGADVIAAVASGDIDIGYVGGIAKLFDRRIAAISSA